MRKLDLAILGYGNTGRAFGKLLLEKTQEIKEKYGVHVNKHDVVFAGVCIKCKS